MIVSRDNMAKPREAGRPRTFEDDDVFRATALVLARLGFRRMTLAQVAAEIPCTPQALIRRFGSRQALLMQYLEWSDEGAGERFRTMLDRSPSALAALRTWLAPDAIPGLDSAGDPNGFGRLLGGWLDARDDPDLLEAWRLRSRQFEQQTVTIVQAAIDEGSLVETDVAALAHQLIVALTGASFYWSMDRGRHQFDEFARAFEMTVNPFLANRA